MKFGFMLPEVLKGFWQSWVKGRPDTVLYPFERLELPKNFRGTIDFVKDKCIGCKSCVRDCPCEAIEIHRDEAAEAAEAARAAAAAPPAPVAEVVQVTPGQKAEPHKVGKKKFRWVYYIDRCCRCNQCVEVCPTDCLVATHNYETAGDDLQKMIVQ